MSASSFRCGLIGALIALASAVSLAQSGKDVLESDWLELVKGYKGSSLGAELVDIQQDETGDPREITLAIPKSAMRHPDEIEEVVVVGQMPDQPDPLELPKLDITYEWLDDYDNDNYGLVIRLGKDSRWPIRLYMNSNAGFIR